jgi:hypothetical protein
LANETLAGADATGVAARAATIRVSPKSSLVDDPLLGIDQRGKFVQQHLADAAEITLPLQHCW